jgi:hypothetical protein
MKVLVTGQSGYSGVCRSTKRRSSLHTTRVERRIDDKSKKMIRRSNDCLIFGDVTCSGDFSNKRRLGPRAFYPYRREI